MEPDAHRAHLIVTKKTLDQWWTCGSAICNCMLYVLGGKRTEKKSITASGSQEWGETSWQGGCGGKDCHTTCMLNVEWGKVSQPRGCHEQTWEDVVKYCQPPKMSGIQSTWEERSLDQVFESELEYSLPPYSSRVSPVSRMWSIPWKTVTLPWLYFITGVWYLQKVSYPALEGNR